MESKVGKHQAVNVTVLDSDALYTATDVENILKEMAVKVLDDGTYYTLQSGANKLLKIRKADGQILIAGGVSTDEIL